MIPKCKCYHETDRYKPYSDGECWGTMEREPCNCRGDKSRCDYYEQESPTEEIAPGEKFATDPIDMDKIMTKNVVTPKNEVNIRKIINDAMEKKDRAVYILILPTSTSVNIMPYEAGTPRWLYDDASETFECPECHNTNAYPAPYCPECGEKLAAAKEDKDGKD